MFDLIPPKLNKKKLKIYLFSFRGVHQNHVVIAGLNYRFVVNLHARVFSKLKPGLPICQMTLLRAIQIQAGVKKVYLAFSLVHISFSENLIYPACAEF